MRKVLVLLLSLVPAVALAQPADPAPDEPATPPAEPAPAPAPPLAPPAGPPAVMPYAPPGYAPPVYAPPPAPATFHRGTTFEVNLGLGFIHASLGTQSDNSDAALGGADLGVGGWLNEHLALTVRLSGVTYVEGANRLTDAFLGPSLQYWIDNNFWIGGGAGLGALGFSNATGDSNSKGGFSLDLRAGYSFSSSSANTFNISVELNPGWYSIDPGFDVSGSTTASYTGVALLAGYQYL